MPGPFHLEVFMSAKEPIDIEDLILDNRLQFRAGAGPYGTDKETIERYSEAMSDGDEFPAVGVIELSEGFEDYEMGDLLVYRGFHRICAARLLGKSLVDCEVRSGTWNDARCLAFKENSAHGKPRTAKDLAKIFEAIKEDYPDISERQMASMAGSSRGSVWRWKKELEPPPKPASKVADRVAPGATQQETIQPASKQPPEVQPSLEPEEEWSDDDQISLTDRQEAEASEPTHSSSRDEDEAPEEVESVDPFADLRADRNEAQEITSGLRSLLKRVERLKGRRGGSRLKYGVCEKNTEDTRRHVDMFTPYVIVPSEVIEILGKDPSDGQGWLHKLGAERLDPAILSKCPKV
jgi:hypothetical protein